MISPIRLTCAVALGALLAISDVGRAAPDDDLHSLAQFRGVYRAGAEHAIGIDSFITDDGTATLLMSDYESGLVRRMFEMATDSFVVGSGFNTDSPLELTVDFRRDAAGKIGGMSVRTAGGGEYAATLVRMAEHQVQFESETASLGGTLIVPEYDGVRPAIALLHGSGPLTRHSFGPYPYFFASLGFAVLVYDKRGTGESTGTRVDASTGRVMAPEIYPAGILADAVAAFRYLRGRSEIDGTRIGFWGSSEGGMLATQAAAEIPQAAFAINSSGFMGPLWQTTLYQAAAYPRRAGASEADIAEYVAFTQQWLEVARTGYGWNEFVARREEMRAKNPRVLFWSSNEFESVEEMRWYWDHVLSFTPLPALARARTPVLGVFGEIDVSTESSVAAENLRRTLAAAGNPDVTVKIFPGANHSLNVSSGAGMAPGVFETLRSWLLMHSIALPTNAQ
jgi:pimeloyl-ACP methyl ester carboxylesterase